MRLRLNKIIFDFNLMIFHLIVSKSRSEQLHLINDVVKDKPIFM
jgi:hypothetical protein